MIVYTAHTRPRSRPVLVREGFSWGAFIFGPIWLLAHRAWIAAVLTICVEVAIGLLIRGPVRSALILGVIWLLGLFGRDIVRWALERRGYAFVHVVTGRDDDAALADLLDRRPDLVPDALR
jgi:hypothetical protein